MVRPRRQRSTPRRRACRSGRQSIRRTWPSSFPGSSSGKWVADRCCCRVPVYPVGVDKGILLVVGDRDDAYRAGHLEHVVRVVRGRHELGERWSAEDSIVRQRKVGDVKGDLLSPEIQLATECYRQRDLFLRLAPSRVDSLERAGFFELAVRNLEPPEDSSGDQIQAGPAVN